MTWKTAAAIAMASLASSTQAFAWGQEGHAAIAEIAQHRLNQGAHDVVERLLLAHLKLKPPASTSMASVASWADDYRAEHKETSNAHFIDIPLASAPGGAEVPGTSYDPKLHCKDDTEHPENYPCLMRTLAAQQAILADPNKDDETRWMALAFVIHLVGDLSQPLHCAKRIDGTQNDSGGNTLTVTFNVSRPAPDNTTYRDLTNFHTVWDTNLILFKYYSWGKVSSDLETKVIPGLDPALLGDDTPEKWLKQCHDTAEAAYRALPKGTQIKSDNPHAVIVDQAYFEKFSPVVMQQLALGGLHLATVLNDTLKAGK